LSDIAINIPWWSLFFVPPVGLTLLIDWGCIALALALAALWLWRSRQAHDVMLLAIAFVASLSTLWIFDEPGFRAFDRRLTIASANFVWFALLLLPFRGLVRRMIAAWQASADPAGPS
jgi:hypothetical protein